MDYTDTYYSRTLATNTFRTILDRNVQCDVCIVGAGLAGLTTALELAKTGQSVLVLEANCVGWGASGRNGGFVSPGYAKGNDAIARAVGKENAQTLHHMSIEGMQIVQRNISELSLSEAEVVEGITGVTRYDSGDTLKIAAEQSAKDFDYPLEYLDKGEVQSRLRSDSYHQGLRDSQAFHIHPLNYARGLAEAAESNGAVIYEKSPAISMTQAPQGVTIKTPKGNVNAQKVVITTGGYTDSLVPKLERSFLPIATYVLITEEAPDKLAEVIKTRDAIGDDRKAADYYRLVQGGNRLLWGGRITTLPAKPEAVAGLLRKEMVNTYPELAGLEVELAWTGLMSYARHQMPQIGCLNDKVWYCTAFGGHGLNTTAIGGKIIAEALLNISDRYRLFEPFGLAWTGGIVGQAAVQTTYWYLQAMDWWKERA